VGRSLSKEASIRRKPLWFPAKVEQECFWLNSTKIEGVKRRDRYNAKERIHQ